jgi:hypothetical protein
MTCEQKNKKYEIINKEINFASIVQKKGINSKILMFKKTKQGFWKAIGNTRFNNEYLG